MIVHAPGMAAWRTVLRHYNGIYVIRDTSDGSLYVGATFASIFDCWRDDYVGDGWKQKKHLGVKTPAHVEKHFRWSLFRVFPNKTEKAVLSEAETLAKKMLGTRVTKLGGLNAN